MRTTVTSAVPGGTRLAIGASTLEINGDSFRIRVELEGLRLHATVAPRGVTTVPSSTRFSDGTLHWTVAPLCEVEGTAVVTGRQLALGVVGYQDHNWGDCAWGSSLAWEWAALHDGDTSIVWMRMLNRDSRAELGRGLLLWEAGRSVGTWTDAQLEVRPLGWFNETAMFTTPAPLRHVLAQRITGVPRQLSIRGSHPAVELTLTTKAAARLVVPDDVAPGFTVINELVCEAELIRDRHHRQARGVWEIVRRA